MERSKLRGGRAPNTVVVIVININRLKKPIKYQGLCIRLQRQKPAMFYPPDPYLKIKWLRAVELRDQER